MLYLVRVDEEGYAIYDSDDETIEHFTADEILKAHSYGVDIFQFNEEVYESARRGLSFECLNTHTGVMVHLDSDSDQVVYYGVSDVFSKYGVRENRKYDYLSSYHSYSDKLNELILYHEGYVYSVKIHKIWKRLIAGSDKLSGSAGKLVYYGFDIDHNTPVIGSSSKVYYLTPDSIGIFNDDVVIKSEKATLRTVRRRLLVGQ